MKNFLILALVFFPIVALAAPTPPCPAGSVCLENPLVGDPTSASKIIGTIIKGVLGILGSLTLLMLIWGGFQWLTSAGNSEKVEKGTKTMLWAIVGVAVVLSAYILISALTNLLSGK